MIQFTPPRELKQDSDEKRLMYEPVSKKDISINWFAGKVVEFLLFEAHYTLHWTEFKNEKLLRAFKANGLKEI